MIQSKTKLPRNAAKTLGVPPEAVNGPPTAVILAAGLGTRLRPLSCQVPKPLFPILNRPLLGLLLAQLEAAGFARVAINTHHRAAEIQHYVETQAPPSLELFLSHEPEILGTGGGLRNLADFLGDLPFLVINGDIVTDLNLAEVYRCHQPDSLATMILHDYPRFNNVWVADTGAIKAFGPKPAHWQGSEPLAFTGIQVVSPQIFPLIPPGVFVNIIDTYRQAIANGVRLAPAVRKDFYWQDIGTPQDYLDIHRRLLAGKVPGLTPFFPQSSDPCLDRGVSLDSGACLAEGVCLGTGVKVGQGASIKNSVIWANAIIDPGVHLEDCVVGQGARISESAQGGCFQA